MSKRTYTMTAAFLKSRCRCDDGDDGCWWWTQCVNNNGHPQMTHQGRKALNAARIMYALVYGKTPGPILVRLCGEKRCMNPKHLASRTRSQAALLQYRFGRMGGGAIKSAKMRAAPPRAKLDWPKVRELRAKLNAGARAMDMAAEYSLSLSTIHQIRKYRTWREGILA